MVLWLRPEHREWLIHAVGYSKKKKKKNTDASSTLHSLRLSAGRGRCAGVVTTERPLLMAHHPGPTQFTLINKHKRDWCVSGLPAGGSVEYQTVQFLWFPFSSSLLYFFKETFVYSKRLFNGRSSILS